MTNQTGPTSITNLPNENEPLEIHAYDLTVTYRLHTYQESLGEGTDKHLEGVLRDWRDGRQPFPVEMIQEGLEKCLKWAIHDVVRAACQEKYGNEMVEVDSGHVARWHLESEKIKTVSPMLNGLVEAKIVEVDPNASAT